MKEYFTYDDVQLKPKFSSIISRKDCNTETKFTRNFNIKVPLIAAPMDTVCEYEMAYALMKLGAVGCVHRFMTIEEQKKIAEQLNGKSYTYENPWTIPICMAIGATGDFFERAQELVSVGANVLVIDVAHGHHIHVKNAIEKLVTLKTIHKFDIVAGNIATIEGACDLESWGADALRVGLGGGALCETRLRTGVGVPQLSCLREIASHLEEQGIGIPIISDGGIRYAGDVAKALCAGSDSIMIGSLFSGTDEAPGDTFVDGVWPNTKKFKMYRGSASATLKLEKNGAAFNVEGSAKMVEYKGDVENIVNAILDGLRSCMSYIGADNVTTMRENADFIRVTPAGVIEAQPHLL